MESQKFTNILNLIKEENLDREERHIRQLKDLSDEISNRDAIIAQKDQMIEDCQNYHNENFIFWKATVARKDREISELKERLEKKNQSAEFWKEKSALSLPLTHNNPATNSEISYAANPLQISSKEENDLKNIPSKINPPKKENEAVKDPTWEENSGAEELGIPKKKKKKMKKKRNK